MASWWNKWKYNQENEQRVRDKLATLGTPCVIEKNKIDNNTKINQDLNLAINNLDIELIKTLIQNGEYINKKYDDGNTPLINAVILNISDNLKMKNQKEIIELLLKIGADVYIKNKYNYNVLEIMTNKSHYDEIRKIFEKYNYFKNTKNENDKYLISLKESRIKKIDLPSSLDNKNLDIFEAISNLDYKTLEKVIDNGIDINQKDENGNTLLIISITNYLSNKEFINIIKLLLENKANPYIENNKNLNAMHIITSHGYSYKEVRDLFKQFDYYKNTKKFNDEYIQNQKSKVLKSLIDKSDKLKKTDVEIESINPTITSREDFSKKLKIKNPNDFIDGATPLYMAIINNDIKKIKQLIDSGADINKKNSDDIPYKHKILEWFEDRKKTPSYIAIKKGNIEIVSFLLEAGAELNHLFKYAIIEENIEFIEFLLKKGANPNKSKNKDIWSFSPLKNACTNQNLKVVKLLIENSADVNEKGYQGQSCLFDAIEATKASKEIIRYLIENGADIHQEDDKGISPLSFAGTNKKSLVKVLTESVPIVLDENIDNNLSISFQELSDKVLKQNTIIKKLQDEIKAIKNDNLDNKIEDLENKFHIQSIEISVLKNELKQKNIEYSTNISDLNTKIEKLEKSLSMKQKTTKKLFNSDIQVKNKSVNQNNGVIVKRESFDDF